MKKALKILLNKSAIEIEYTEKEIINNIDNDSKLIITIDQYIYFINNIKTHKGRQKELGCLKAIKLLKNQIENIILNGGILHSLNTY